MYNLMQKMRNKVIKKIDAIPFFQHQENLAYAAAVEQHKINLPSLENTDLDILERINRDGVVITSFADLGISSTPDILAAAQKLIPKISPNISTHKNEFVVHASSQQIMEYPEIFLWGMEQRLLNIVENYLGLPVAYNGMYFRRDIANKIEQGSRLWHIDREDKKILKIIIYLNDINEDTGPFQYIPPDLTLEIAKALKYTSGYIQESIMREFISPQNYKSCTGTVGAVIFAATGSIFHRGKIPLNSDRFAIFYDYSSRRQKKKYYLANSLPQQDLLMLSKNLPKYKKECISY